MTLRKRKNPTPFFRLPPPFNPLTGESAELQGPEYDTRLAYFQVYSADTHANYVVTRGYDPSCDHFFNGTTGTVSVAKPYALRGTYPYKIGQILTCAKVRSRLGDNVGKAKTSQAHPADLNEAVELLTDDAGKGIVWLHVLDRIESTFKAKINYGTTSPTVVGGKVPWACTYPWIEVEQEYDVTPVPAYYQYTTVEGGRSSAPTTMAYHTLEEYGNSLPVIRHDVVVTMHEEPGFTPTSSPRYWFDAPLIESGYASLHYTSGIGAWRYVGTATAAPSSSAYLLMKVGNNPKAEATTGPAITVYYPTAPRSDSGGTYTYLKVPIGYEGELVRVRLGRDTQAGAGSDYAGGIVMDEEQNGPWKGVLTDDLVKGTSAPCNIANEKDNPANSRSVMVFDVLMTEEDEQVGCGAPVLVMYSQQHAKLVVTAAKC